VPLFHPKKLKLDLLIIYFIIYKVFSYTWSYFILQLFMRVARQYYNKASALLFSAVWHWASYLISEDLFP
jgi:hypothetical protein